MLEEDLFEPVKELFEQIGYKINAEVENCDITATRDDEVIIIELKKNLSVTLLAQGVNRQKLGANVYVAIPKPKKYNRRKWKDKLFLLKKLELGLIFVNQKEDMSFAEIVLCPERFAGNRTSSKKQKSLISEIKERTLNQNIGGSVRKKIATAYKEKAIYIACVLEKYGELSPKEIRKHGTDAKKTTSILYDNYYGWFVNVKKGVYALSNSWEKASEEYEKLVSYYRELVNREDNIDV